MATYTKTTNFTAKDNLTSGDPAKVIKGSEFDTEFNAIETAVNSKANANNGTHTGTTTIATADIDNLQIDSVAVTATAAELNTLDGITASTAELNITDGLTATTAELNTLDGITSTTTELNKLDGFTGDVTDLNKLASVTATATEINVLDGSTASTADLNKLAGVTATSTELNLLDGVTATTAEINFVDGVTSNIQTQLDNKQPLDAQLTDIAGLTPTDGTFIVGNGTNFVAESGDTAIASLGITATATELNTLDGITATTAELNYTDGVTSNIQTQLDAMVEKAGDTMTGDLSLGDNVKAKFGAGDDLQIYHSGSHSFVSDTGTGRLYLQGTDGVRVTNASAVNMISAVSGDGVYSYYNGSLKLATTSTGVDVTGTVTADAVDTTSVSCDGLTVEGNNTGGLSVPNNTITLLDTDTSSTAGQAFGAINFSSSDTSDAGTPVRITGVCEFGGSVAGSLQFETGTPSNLTKAMQISYNGDVSFYEDTGTTAKMVWDSSYESLDIGSNFSDSVKNFGTNTKLAIGGSIVLDGGSGNDVDILNYRTSNLNLGTGGSTDLTIDSSGNVGIGTSSPNSYTNLTALTLNGTSGSLVDFEVNGTVKGELYASTAAMNISAYGTHHIAFTTTDAGTERMRLDSSGNLLVGKTSDNPNTQGVQAYSSGILAVSKDSGRPLYINRNTTDGALVDFVKDGLTVGSIGAYGSTTFIQSGSAADYCGVLFNSAGGTGYIQPTLSTGSSGADPRTDNAVSLGNSSHRFKDLYLSGGVYLGGTGSANKLDDYETGNFSPNALATFTVNNCSYTKIGRMVMLNIDVECPISSSGTAIQLGIPFTPSGATYNGSGTISYTDNRTDIQSFEVQTSSGRLQIRKSDENIATFADCSGYRVIGSVIYEANA